MHNILLSDCDNIQIDRQTVDRSTMGYQKNTKSTKVKVHLNYLTENTGYYRESDGSKEMVSEQKSENIGWKGTGEA